MTRISKVCPRLSRQISGCVCRIVILMALVAANPVGADNGDCAPTGDVTTTITRVTVERCAPPLTQPVTCEDGSVHEQTIITCDYWDIISVEHSYEMAMPDGTPCPPRVVRLPDTEEFVGSIDFYEPFDPCGNDEGMQCCDLISEGWNYEVDEGYEDIEWDIYSEPWDGCPDGEVGTIVFFAKVTNGRRRRVDFKDWDLKIPAPLGCSTSDCEDVRIPGAWEEFEKSRETTYMVFCSVEDEEQESHH